MKDAMEWKKSQQKANKNRDHEETSKSSAKKSSANKAPVSDTSAEVKRNDKSQTGADNKLDVPQEAAICGNNNKEPMEIKRKASSPTSSAKSSSPPTLPRLTGPSPPAQQAAVGSNDQLKFNVREVTSEKSCFSSETLPPSKEKSQEPGNQGEVTSSSSRRKRNQRKKKASKSLKWLNPFSKQSNDGQGYLSSVNMDPNVPKNDSSDVVEGGAVANGEELSKRRKENVVLCSTPVEPVLKKAKPCVAVSVREYEELDGYRRSPELETSSSNGSTLDEARPIPPVDASPCEKETPLHPEVGTPCNPLALVLSEKGSRLNCRTDTAIRFCRASKQSTNKITMQYLNSPVKQTF